MHKAMTTVLAVSLGLLLSTTAARAQETTKRDFYARDANGSLVAEDNRAGFGAPHQWAFSSDAALSFQRQTVSNTNGSVTTITLAPSVDYFVIKNLSVGGLIGVDYRKAGSSHGTRFQIGPRVGYNFAFSRLLSLWPKLGFSYAHTSTDYQNVGRINSVTGLNTAIGNNKSNAIALNIFVPVVVHPAPHFFAGFGPFVDTDLSGDNRATVWGLKLTLGGWVNSHERG